MLRLLVDLYALLVGLIAGSYLNVVIHRLPRRISTVLPRSRCPRCGAEIRARDNIPIVSFLLLGGHCRQCGLAISWRYPVVEAMTAALFVLAVETWGLTVRSLVGIAFGCLLIALAAIDWEHYLLPDLLTIPGLLAGLAVAPFAPWIGWLEALLGAVLGGGGLWLLARAWLLLRGEEGMGLGDVKMLAMIGAFLGWGGVLVTLLLSSLAGSIVGLTLIAAGEMGMKSRLPFGTFLAAGALVALFVGPFVVERYAALLRIY